MKLKKWLYSSFFALAATLMFVGNASAYSSSAAAPTIYSKNWSYNVAYPVLGTPPRGAYITNVYYTWNYASRPGLLVYICGASTCWNVTNSRSGSINMSGENQPANQPVKLYSMVQGTGTMAPLAGGRTTVSVNF